MLLRLEQKAETDIYIVLSLLLSLLSVAALMLAVTVLNDIVNENSFCVNYTYLMLQININCFRFQNVRVLYTAMSGSDDTAAFLFPLNCTHFYLTMLFLYKLLHFYSMHYTDL